MMKKSRDLGQFKNVLPYASEIFGVYQPLIGWKSGRTLQRLQRAFADDKGTLLMRMFHSIVPAFDASAAPRVGAGPQDSSGVSIKSIQAGSLAPRLAEHHSFLLDELARRLPTRESMTADAWDRLLDEKVLNAMLSNQVKKRIAEVQSHPEFRAVLSRGGSDPDWAVMRQAARESMIARYLLEAKKAGHVDAIEQVFFGDAKPWTDKLAMAVAAGTSLDLIDPHHDLDRVTLSPISIVHLFRQYFFEFDSFLGPPVSHVWLSPGSQVELVEIQTRRTVTEKTLESEVTSTTRAESEVTEQDELSDAVKESNRNTTQFGFNTSVHQGWVGGDADASASINLENTQEKARETSHKHMRQQTEKMSTEIRKNYKSTFKTMSEVTDTSSKRYLLANTTDKLINYELRRKLRQVGVQVQDIGTYLCWQTFVDDPGRQLGVSELVHIAKSPETGNISDPSEASMPEPYLMKTSHTISFFAKGDDTNDEDRDETYRNGKEVDLDANEGDPERIDPHIPTEAVCDKANYVFAGGDDAISIDVKGNVLEVDVRDVQSSGNTVSFEIYLKQVNFQGQSALTVEATTRWLPDPAMVDKINAENLQKVDQRNAEAHREFVRVCVEGVRERIKLASRVKERKFEELREEERIAVYRMLIQDMLTKDLPLKDDRTRHAVAELLNSIFDVDKMLYFVAPEWWRPRLHPSVQQLNVPAEPPPSGKVELAHAFASKVLQINTADKLKVQVTPVKQVEPQHTVGWGGEHRTKNYYITEDSEPAKLGSSLGWLLQLDGDNRRNAFLNAPWVKAVIPIRPGKEKAAFNWLQRVGVEGAEGLNAAYAAPQSELQHIPHSGSTVTIKDAILHLCSLVAAKHAASNQVGKYPVDEINDDNKVSATPLDKVYEHGFYPNQDGFKILMGGDFEVFDQWVEILPTDQVVPVEVEYDPITGRQIQIVEIDE